MDMIASASTSEKRPAVLEQPKTDVEGKQEDEKVVVVKDEEQEKEEEEQDGDEAEGKDEEEEEEELALACLTSLLHSPALLPRTSKVCALTNLSLAQTAQAEIMTPLSVPSDCRHQ
mmetsp:Transcript_20217/g.39507  ORF Transcript_20217/g.39507 Transcript_20217/m.39507 type:complete len:116 (-) Transcript_20217:495-842(-)